MVKDKYLKESLNFQRLNDLAKKYNLTNYMPGQSFDSVKDNMSAEDYETSQKLLSYYTNQQNLSNNYQADVDTAEINRQKSIEQNRIAREKTMQYLPQYLKSQGLGGLGVSESAIISANNDFRNASNSINTNANTLKADLLKNYKGNILNLDNIATDDVQTIKDKYEEIARQEKERAEEIARLEREQQKESVSNHYHQEMLSNPEYFTEDGSKMTEDGKNKIKEYLDSNKEVLGGLYDTFITELDSYAVYTNAEKQTLEEENQNQKNAHSLGGYGDGILVNEAKESDFGSYNGTGKSGDAQKVMVDTIITKAQRGEIQDGTLIDFNYGAGVKKGSVYIYYGGKFYPTNYSRDYALKLAREGHTVLGYDYGNRYTRVN